MLSTQEPGSSTTNEAVETTGGQTPSALTHEEKVEAAKFLLRTNPLNREILFRVLQACQEKRWFLHELEEYIQGRAEFAVATQPPYFLIKWLADVEALDVLEIDISGKIIDPAQLEGLTEDEIDDIVEDNAFETNEVGKEVIAYYSPLHRIEKLLNIAPARYETYVEVLEFLQEKRDLSEIDKLLRGRDILMDGRAKGERPMQPTVFIDKLAGAGGIVWNKGWIISEEGKELLKAIKEKSS